MNSILALWMFLLPQAGALEPPFDIAPFARPCCRTDKHELQTTFEYSAGRGPVRTFAKMADRYVFGLQWAEERDIEILRMRFSAAFVNGKLSLQYWYQNWPYPPPSMPTIEDPVDDPWQGQWLTAAAKISCAGAECEVSFLPLAVEENPRAKNLPGLHYRRTLKIRLVADRQPPPIQKIQVYSQSVQKTTRVRLELGAGVVDPSVWEGELIAYNGTVSRVEGWRTSAGDRVSGTSFRLETGPETKGLLFEVQGADARPSGSHDVTVVTVRSGVRTFSIALPDLEQGSIYIPALHAYATLASDPQPFGGTAAKAGRKIRARLAEEPEQTYERARREIPQLDPVERQGGRLYLPLASDSSWQKFALEWGGNIAIDKRGTKAKGNERRRLEWSGDRISWRIGTGAVPTFRPLRSDSELSVLEDYLPVATATWRTDGIAYSEEAFVTQLSGPLSIEGRNEQTPSVLLAKITAHNPTAAAQTSHLWLATDPAEDLEYRDGEVLGGGGGLIRARIRSSAQAGVVQAEVTEGSKILRGVHIQAQVPPRGESVTYMALPFIPRLSELEKRQLAVLEYEAEREKVIAYWRNLIHGAVRFSIPEKRFEDFARAVITHMHVSTTRDPKSGLFMVPAASYFYPVFANEACFRS